MLAPLLYRSLVVNCEGHKLVRGCVALASGVPSANVASAIPQMTGVFVLLRFALGGVYSKLVVGYVLQVLIGVTFSLQDEAAVFSMN